MKIALIYNKENESTTGAYIEKVIASSGINYQHFWTKDAQTIGKQFDLYLRIDHGDYKYDLPHYLHPAVFYVIDTHLKKPYKRIKRQVGHYDIVFCAQKEGAEKIKRAVKLDTQWLPLGCDPEIHRQLDVDKSYDIGFVGSPARKFARGKLLDLLAQKYPKSYLKPAPFRKMGEIYSASKIGFNSSIVNDINMRIFEIMSSGCLLITNKIKNNGFEELFKDREHLITYRNAKELLELTEYYLDNPNERKRIAQAGFELVTKKHTYYHRVQAMFNYIAFKLGGDYSNLRI